MRKNKNDKGINQEDTARNWGTYNEKRKLGEFNMSKIIKE